MNRDLRRPVLIGLAAVLLAAGIVALVLPATTTPATTGDARVTRLFIPAIKEACRLEAQVPPDAVLGYTFTAGNALVTIDRDGSLTGVGPEVLQALNTCMAQYPIQPTIELPRDHYTRNLLYDYYVSDLRPCLTDRVSDLPAMPSRADFVVRLYQWDPYRVLTRTLPLAQLLDYDAACPPLPEWLLD